MKPERHRRAKELVIEAERLEPAAREALVEGACAGDSELRREVLRLLEVASRTPQDFLEPPSHDQESAAAKTSIRVGQTLGRFRVTGRLGAGGMGEVLRAQDTDLRREVALKVLPTEFSRNSERLARFRREAQALAALKHPNIVTVYSIEEAAGLHFLCMELVEGKTLGELIPAEGLPLPRFFELVGPLVDAVAAAHDRGVVHRDIKPTNVMLSTDGELKVLDFGLAKLRATGAKEAEGTELTGWQTEGMRVLGTPAYAAPEQLEGRGADHRSDIFSLGVVLYRMLSGRAPFAAATEAATVASVLRDRPRPIGELLPDLPAGLDRILERCLEKDPAARYASAADLRRDLRTLREAGHRSEGETETLLPEPGRAADGRQVRPTTARDLRRRRLLAAAVGAALVVAAVAIVSLYLGGDRGSPAPTYSQLTFREGTVWAARFASDGRTVVYSAAWEGEPARLFTARPGSPESRPLDLPPAHLLSISRNDVMAFLENPRFLFTFRRVGTLARADLAGGAHRQLARDVHEADWGPDGELAVVRSETGRFTVEYPRGRPLYASEHLLREPRVSPDGSWIALWEHAIPNFDCQLIAVSAEGKHRVLSSGWPKWSSGVAWPPGGREVWFTGAQAGTQAVRAVTLGGRQRRVAQVPGEITLFDISAAGQALLAQRSSRLGVRLRTAGEDDDRDLSWFDGSFLLALAEDGSSVVFSEVLGEEPGIYLRRADGSPAVLLEAGEFKLLRAAISPDGRWVALVNDVPPRLISTAAGEGRDITALPACNEVDWFPDGARLLCASADPSRGVLIVLDLTSDAVSEIPVPANSVDRLRISPGGDWIAATADGELAVYPAAGGDPRPGLRGHRDLELAGWCAASDCLYLYRIGEVPAKIYRLDLETGELDVWREIRPAEPAGIWRIHPIEVAGDGSYAYTYTRHLSTLYLVDGLR